MISDGDERSLHSTSSKRAGDKRASMKNGARAA
jgi:hypothetical protein